MKATDIALFYKSLSEPVRLRIVNLLLQQNELCVCDIITALSLPQSVVSRHLAYLKKRAIVTSRRQGNWQYYALSSMTPTHPLHHLFNSLKQTLANCSEANHDIEILNQAPDCCVETSSQ